jgi:hypothetical protein
MTNMASMPIKPTASVIRTTHQEMKRHTIPTTKKKYPQMRIMFRIWFNIDAALAFPFSLI